MLPHLNVESMKKYVWYSVLNGKLVKYQIKKIQKVIVGWWGDIYSVLSNKIAHINFYCIRGHF